ncbi:hypothetical protein D4764_15G0000290 [Takifugu flavidus]|uniref:Uncharacterized protein n=1 Tax=Takifugu flavidus TaxID=433684 RepID=A0A5C6P022_9TELE|nr:hypothetical protein D4764_15G0000290 [Takifugu flavidus]
MSGNCQVHLGDLGSRALDRSKSGMMKFGADRPLTPPPLCNHWRSVSGDPSLPNRRDCSVMAIRQAPRLTVAGVALNPQAEAAWHVENFP